MIQAWCHIINYCLTLSKPYTRRISALCAELYNVNRHSWRYMALTQVTGLKFQPVEFVWLPADGKRDSSGIDTLRDTLLEAFSSVALTS